MWSARTWVICACRRALCRVPGPAESRAWVMTGPGSRTLTLTELYILTCSGDDDDIFFCPELGTTDRGTCR